MASDEIRDLRLRFWAVMFLCGVLAAASILNAVRYIGIQDQLRAQMEFNATLLELVEKQMPYLGDDFEEPEKEREGLAI